ncbi:hypothetical protein Q5P01_019362 [Channa striata]|uniref:Uncharacterized protein n=1 Tax=Channa striata TaxID=64152 RepID=A0AA88SBJ9_CHASR|nr:hypothetical protein Q5P01_019362 [Channa striata]
MADADGATKFSDIEKVEAGLNELNPKPGNLAISCGSRAHLEKDSVAQRSVFRTFLMYGFHFLSDGPLMWSSVYCPVFQNPHSRGGRQLDGNRRFKAGSILELAADGERPDFYSPALHHRSLETAVTK